MSMLYTGNAFFFQPQKNGYFIVNPNAILFWTKPFNVLPPPCSNKILNSKFSLVLFLCTIFSKMIVQHIVPTRLPSIKGTFPAAYLIT